MTVTSDLTESDGNTDAASINYPTTLHTTQEPRLKSCTGGFTRRSLGDVVLKHYTAASAKEINGTLKYEAWWNNDKGAW